MISSKPFTNNLDVGTRVRVCISKPDEYAHGAAESLNGKTGVIEQLRRDGSMWLVTFDEPAAPWSANQQPCTGFWFEPYELEVLS